MVKSGANLVGSFSEIHVYVSIDIGPFVYYNIYIRCQESKNMNRLNLQRRAQVINCLVEGNSIHSTERMTDTHRDTIMRLLVQVAERSPGE